MINLDIKLDIEAYHSRLKASLREEQKNLESYLDQYFKEFIESNTYESMLRDVVQKYAMEQADLNARFYFREGQGKIFLDKITKKLQNDLIKYRQSYEKKLK